MWTLINSKNYWLIKIKWFWINLEVKIIRDKWILYSLTLRIKFLEQ